MGRGKTGKPLGKSIKKEEFFSLGPPITPFRFRPFFFLRPFSPYLLGPPLLSWAPKRVHFFFEGSVFPLTLVAKGYKVE